LIRLEDSGVVDRQDRAKQKQNDRQDSPKGKKQVKRGRGCFFGDYRIQG